MGITDAQVAVLSGLNEDSLSRWIRRFTTKGEKKLQPHSGANLRRNVTGAVLPRTGEFYALEFSHSDREVFQTFLDNANKDLYFERPRNLLILDNASWHKSKSLDWGKFESVYQPPYSPDLNRIERLWLIMKAEWFSGFYAKTKDQLIDRLSQALMWLIDRKNENTMTCAIPTDLKRISIFILQTREKSSVQSDIIFGKRYNCSFHNVFCFQDKRAR